MSGLSFILGMIVRRWWGGWLSPSHWGKISAVFFLSSGISFISGFDYFSLVNGLVITLAFLNTFHGEGMNMGHNKALPFWACIGVMGGSYSFYTSLLGVAMSYTTGNWLYMCVAPVGFLIAFSYALAWVIYKPWMNIKYPGEYMLIDGAGSLGEFMLGALLFSCVPFAKLFIGE